MKIENIILNNKYSKWYLSICNNALHRASSRKQAKDLLGYVEGHHVLPNSIFKNTNIVYVTPKEHFILHHLLTKMLVGNNKHKMEYAFSMFSQGRTLTAIQHSICDKYRFLKHSESTKKSISNSRKLTPKICCEFCSTYMDPGNYKRFHGTNCKQNPDVDIEMLKSRSELNRKSTLKSIQSGTYQYKNITSDILTCPYCGKAGTNRLSMAQFHFERCPQAKDLRITSHSVSDNDSNLPRI